MRWHGAAATAARADGADTVHVAQAVRADGKALRRSGELMGLIATVLFAPEDLALVKAGPGERRRFIDMERRSSGRCTTTRCSATTARSSSAITSSGSWTRSRR